MKEFLFAIMNYGYIPFLACHNIYVDRYEGREGVRTPVRRRGWVLIGFPTSDPGMTILQRRYASPDLFRGLFIFFAIPENRSRHMAGNDRTPKTNTLTSVRIPE